MGMSGPVLAKTYTNSTGRAFLTQNEQSLNISPNPISFHQFITLIWFLGELGQIRTGLGQFVSKRTQIQQEEDS